MDTEVETQSSTSSKKPKIIQEVCKRIGWIEAEITRLRGKGPNKCTKKRAQMLKKLSYLVGGNSKRLDLRTLLSLRGKQKALLKVKVAQRRKTKRVQQKQATNEKYILRGPNSLAQQTTANKITVQQARDVFSFCNGVWGQEGEYNCRNEVLHQWKAEMRERSEPTTEDEPLDREVALGIALLKLSSWKAPGPDGIQGYWLRVFPRACNLLKTHFWKILDEEDNMPDWLIRGRTVLIPKEGSTGSPDQYRPITCLNTMYKLFTSVLTRMLMHHVSSKNLLPEEQKALRSKT